MAYRERSIWRKWVCIVPRQLVTNSGSRGSRIHELFGLGNQDKEIQASRAVKLSDLFFISRHSGEAHRHGGVDQWACCSKSISRVGGMARATACHILYHLYNRSFMIQLSDLPCSVCWYCRFTENGSNLVCAYEKGEQRLGGLPRIPTKEAMRTFVFGIFCCLWTHDYWRDIASKKSLLHNPH